MKLRLTDRIDVFFKKNFVNFKNFDGQDFFKAKMMILGLINLIILNILNIFFAKFSAIQLILSYVNIVVWVFLFLYTLKVKNINNCYKIMSIYGTLSASLHALFSSGIYSSYIFWFPIICLGMSIFLNRSYAIMCAIYSMLAMTFFVVLQVNNIVDFKSNVNNVPVYFDYINIMSILTMLSLILYFSFTKENVELFWKKQNLEKIDHLEIQLSYKTSEIKKMRNDMATEFHDEMGNKLALISTYINVLQLQNLGDNSKLSGYLDQINTNAKEVYEGTRDFIWTIEADHANFYELGVYLRDFGERIFLPVDVDFITGCLSEKLKNIRTTFIENHQIVLIVKEAMTNAMKHSQTKKIELNFNIINEDYVELIVKDYGKGFNEKNISRFNGIANMQKRAEKINSELNYVAIENNGVEICLKYPINKFN